MFVKVVRGGRGADVALAWVIYGSLTAALCRLAAGVIVGM